jgi:hypothetical protein
LLHTLFLGAKLPHLYERAGLGAPDGMRVTARLWPLSEIAGFLKMVYRSFLPAALKLGITTEARSAAFFDQMERAAGEASAYLLGPLVVAVWKRKPTP